MRLDPRPGTHNLDEITPEVATLLKLIPNQSGLRGVEVGTLRGRTATLLLANRPGLVMWVIDNWDCGDIVTYEDADAVCRAALRNFSSFDERVCVINGESTDIAARISDDRAADWDRVKHISDMRSWDFVYLDAKHDLKSVIADILAWWPKVRPGGILCGHDYGREKPRNVPGPEWRVKEAVDAFMADEGLELFIEGVVWAVKK